jgi:hypothetical protein
MHLLPCPACDRSIAIAPSQAGDRTNCPHCHCEVDIPTLGQLRQLAVADRPAEQSPPSATEETSVARRIGFGLFSLLAAGSLLVAGYCGIRWFLIEVPATSAKHVEALRTEYMSLDPALLIGEYEEMEKYGLDLPEPYEYKTLENARHAWGRNTVIAAVVALLSILVTVALAATDRRKMKV